MNYQNDPLENAQSAKKLAVTISITVTALLAVTIAVLTLTPMPAGVGGGSDKLYHVLAFASVALPIPLVLPRLALWALLCAAAYGGAIELIQPSFGRQAEWADFAADCLGAAIGATLGYGLSRILPWHSFAPAKKRG